MRLWSLSAATARPARLPPIHRLSNKKRAVVRREHMEGGCSGTGARVLIREGHTITYDAKSEVIWH